MTVIKKKYVGITHPLGEAVEMDEFCKAWKQSNCAHGIHAFDEVLSDDSHFLVCDVCGMEVYIEKIIIPDGKEDIIE